MNRFFRCLIFILFLASINSTFANSFAVELLEPGDPPERHFTSLLPDDDDIIYDIKPLYTPKSIKFSVTLTFKGNPLGKSTLMLPGKFGGQDNLPCVENLHVVSQFTSMLDTGDPTIKDLKYAPNSVIIISYLINELPRPRSEVVLGNQFLPVINKKYYHFLGESLFAIPADDWGREFNFKINWTNYPSDWSIANSFGVNEKKQLIRLPLWKFRHAVFVGGDFRISMRLIENHPVYLAMRGNWSFSDTRLIDVIKTIIAEQRAFWNDYDFPSYLVTVLPVIGNNEQTGTGRYNSYALFLSTDRVIDYKFMRLLAHETFHAWVGDKIKADRPEELVYWFTEGFTEYYARLLLLRTGLISLTEYAEEYNDRLNEYFTSPVRYESSERLIKEFWTNDDLHRLPYLRGDIIAHNLNAAIYSYSKGKKNLDEFMRDLLARGKDNILISNATLSALIRFYAGEKALSDIMATVNSGKTLKTRSDALGKCFNMEIDTERKYWLLGEKYEIPQYIFNEDRFSANPLDCINWFRLYKIRVE